MPIDSIRFPFHFEGWVRDAIYRLKYDGEIARARHLAPALAACLPDLRTLDAIVPVPLHRRRLRERGFNQAMELALVVGKLAHVPVIDVLRRDRYTDHQTRLSADSRRANVSDAFSLTSSMPVSGTRLLLLDDVLTTGSTSAACARALRGGGAAQVSVLTLAREH